ncbi:MAG: polymer-forming cytoskeletal protein [Actinobacteria bacterium]|nr:polymer-forming cytoskeletal protein [Actinomycetota bacterium]
MVFSGKVSHAEENYENVLPENKKSRTLLTITGEEAKIEGKLIVSQSIEIDCEVKGELEVNGELVIQRNGFVNADVKTVDAQIIGSYQGNMEATGNVEIKETGRVHGNIKTDSLIINKGGIFSGNVTRISEEKEKIKPKPKYGKVLDFETEKLEEKIEEEEKTETELG